MPGNDTQARAVPADAGGEVGRTNAVARFLDEELFHHPVLERVERDDREPATGTQERKHGCETQAQIRKLVVHRDAQRLEDAGRGIDRARAPLLHTEDEAPEVVRGQERFARTAPLDRGRDAAGLGLLAVIREHVTERGAIPAVHDVCRGDGESWVGAHVQWSRRSKAEAALRVRELDRRETEVEKSAVDLLEPALAGQTVRNREVALREYGALAESGEDASRFVERLWIDVEPEKPAGRRGAVEDRRGMSSPTDRAVEEAATFAGIKLGEYFGQKNRLMEPPRSFIVRPPGP
jgi:hypothetical protein